MEYDYRGEEGGSPSVVCPRLVMAPIITIWWRNWGDHICHLGSVVATDVLRERNTSLHCSVLGPRIVMDPPQPYAVLCSVLG